MSGGGGYGGYLKKGPITRSNPKPINPYKKPSSKLHVMQTSCA